MINIADKRTSGFVFFDADAATAGGPRFNARVFFFATAASSVLLSLSLLLIVSAKMFSDTMAPKQRCGGDR